MSETDDTDELLLIPPDLFVNNCDLEFTEITTFGPYYNIVDGLITQVNYLEDRVNSIENTSTLTNNSLDSFSSMYRNPVPGIKKYSSNEDLVNERNAMYSQSAQNTPQKPRTFYTLSSLPNTPNINRFNNTKVARFNARKSPQKFNVPKKLSDHQKKSDSNEMLDEIDNFLSHVKTIKKLHAVRNLENEYNKSADVNRVDQMLKNVDLQHQKLEERIKSHEQRLSHSPEKLATKETTWKCGENVNTVPDYGFGMRNSMYADNLIKQPIVYENFQKNSINPSQNQMSSDREMSTTVDRSDSSDSTQMTVFNKQKFGEVLSNPVNDVNLLEIHDIKSKKDSEVDDLKLVSLSNLWGTSANDLQNEGLLTKFKYQLHEEKLRRQHCEQIIQKLQNNNLELQERLAVAVKVDESKDNAILQFHDSWEKMSLKVQELEEDKLHLQQEINELQLNNSKNMKDASQKISHYEEEASKALNLAHNSQEKLSYFESQFTELHKELESYQHKYEEIKKNYDIEVETTKHIHEIMSKKEIELAENKTLLTEARNEITQSKKAVEFCQNELNSIKNQYTELELNFQAERKRSTELNERKLELITEVNNYKEKMESLQKQLADIEKIIENNKAYMKGYYQEQMEKVLKTKVSALQNQLDEAVTTVKDNLKKKECTIAKNAAAHIQQISEKYAEEIRLLEQRHQEEMRLCQLELSQYRKQIDEMNFKFNKQQERRALIDRQLIKFMESLQQQDQSLNSIDQVNSFKSKSFLNLEELLSQNGVMEENSDGYINLKNVVDKSGETDGQSTYRLSSNKKHKNKQQGENDFQKYLHMVYKPPSSSSGGGPTLVSDSTKNLENFQTDKTNWHSLTLNEAVAHASKSEYKERKSDKPPWK